MEPQIDEKINDVIQFFIQSRKHSLILELD